MNSTGINRLKSKLGWIFKKKKLKKYGTNSHVGYNLVLKNANHISIGDNFIAGKNLTMEVWNSYNNIELDYNSEIIIEDNVSIMDDCQLSAACGIYIGNGTLIGSNVFITDNFHGNGRKDELMIPPVQRPLYVKGKVIIGNNVWIGRNVCIMPNVKIGDGVVIGANSVVTHDIPAECIVAGVPAKIINN